MKAGLSLLLLFWTLSCRSLFVPGYETGSEIQTSRVRILLAEAKEEEVFKGQGALEVLDANDLLIKKTYDSVFVNPSSLKAPIRILSGNGILEYKSIAYRGEFHLVPENGRVYVLNVLPLEDYLLSVVPSEMPSSWPEEALKAQAVCARTYALREMMNKKNKPYDLEATTNSQLYKGIPKEDPRSTKAVRDTEGLILVHNGKPIHSFFHSNSGGKTEDPSFVWGNSVAYLPSVPSDFDKIGDAYAWEDRIPEDQMNSLLGNQGIGVIQDVMVQSRTPSDRVDKIELLGSRGSKTIKGAEFRKLLGERKLKSTRFGIRKEEDGSYFVRGLGYGHGVGLSQWGSYGMAKENYEFSEILRFYYRDVELVRLR